MKKPRPNYLVVISVDALNDLDYNFIKTLPNFSRFIKEGAVARNVSSIYPTVTYTCHASIVTGNYPAKHGVYNNEFAEPERFDNQHWRWHERENKSPTLFDYAKKAGLQSAAVLWPVMADSASLNWNVPEIWPVDGESSFRLFWENGSRNMLPAVLRYKHLLDGKSQPGVDNFTESIACSIIKGKKPDLLFVHLTEVDTIRHQEGLRGPKVEEALSSADRRIGRIMDVCRKAGIYDSTNFILLGDHGGNDFETVVEINSFLKNNGLLSTDDAGRITDWTAYGCTCGGSVHIHMHPEASDSQEKKVHSELERLMDLPGSPISRMFTAEEAREQFNLEGGFTFILEAADGYAFRNGASGQLLHEGSTYGKHYKLDHGFLPGHPNLKTMLLAKGPDIKKGAAITGCSLVDEGPTFAALLGLNMEKTDGRVLHEIIELD